MVKCIVVIKSNPAFSLMTEGSHDKIPAGLVETWIELGISQIRVQCVAVEYHHVKDFAASMLKRKISALSWLAL